MKDKMEIKCHVFSSKNHVAAEQGQVKINLKKKISTWSTGDSDKICIHILSGVTEATDIDKLFRA